MITVANEVWSTELLRLLKAPETPANYQFLNAWATREHNGGPALSDGSNNPFFTTAGAGSGLGDFKSGTFPNWNSLGVAKYPNLEVGVYLNAAHISKGYPAIADALRSGNPGSFANNAAFQHDLTRWSGSGYSSVMSSGGASGPIGPTVDTKKISEKVIAAVKGGSLNDAARHIPGVAQVEGAASATADAGSAVASFFGTITDPHNILRGLQIIAGGGMVAIGVVLLAKQVALAADLPSIPGAGVASSAAGAVASSGPATRRREGKAVEQAHREGQLAGDRAAARSHGRKQGKAAYNARQAQSDSSNLEYQGDLFSAE